MDTKSKDIRCITLKYEESNQLISGSRILINFKDGCTVLNPFIYKSLAEVPAVAREKNRKKIIKKKEKNKNFDFLKPITPSRPPMSVHKKFQPIRSSRLAGYVVIVIS